MKNYVRQFTFIISNLLYNFNYKLKNIESIWRLFESFLKIVKFTKTVNLALQLKKRGNVNTCLRRFYLIFVNITLQEL